MRKLVVAGLIICCFMSGINVYAQSKDTVHLYLGDASSNASIGFAEKTYHDNETSSSDSISIPQTSETQPVKPSIGHLPSTNEQKSYRWFIMGIICVLSAIYIVIQYKRGKSS